MAELLRLNGGGGKFSKKKDVLESVLRTGFHVPIAEQNNLTARR